MAENGTGLKRYNLAIPEALYEEIKMEAEKRHTTSISVFRLVIELGLRILKLSNSPNTKLVVIQDDNEFEIFIPRY